MGTSSALVEAPESIRFVAVSWVHFKNWKRKILFSLLGGAALVLGGGVSQTVLAEEPAIAVSPETTYLTEPLTPSGWPDYAAFLNSRLGDGVTPETNAAVKLLEAVGPLPDQFDLPLHEALAEELGMPPLSVEGHYFVDIDRWLKEKNLSVVEISQQSEELYRELSATQAFPWKTAEHPEMVSWFERNEAPLKLVHEAIQRPHFYRPLVFEPTDLRTYGKLAALKMHDIGTYGLVGQLLCSRAMWHLGEGRLTEAQQDLLDAHRLSRHLKRGWLTLQLSLAHKLEDSATAGAAALMVDPRLTAAQARSYRKELEKLGPVLTQAEVVQVVNEGERFLALDTLIGLATQQITPSQLSWQTSTPGEFLMVEGIQQLGVNWNKALIEMNRQYDELVAALSLSDQADRAQAMQLLQNQHEEDMNRLGEWPQKVTVLVGGGAARGRMLVTLVVDTFLWGGEFYPMLHDSATMQWQVTQVGLALAEYRHIQGRYPERLAALQPKFLAEIPEDIFSGKPLVYQVSEDGLEMKVYSVGYNGVDDGGIRSSGDDIGILDPIPAIPEDAAESTEVE